MFSIRMPYIADIVLTGAIGTALFKARLIEN